MIYHFEDYVNDSKTKDAVERNLLIIGEASNKIPEEYKSKYPKIGWRKLNGLRNSIVNEDFGVENSIVWYIIENEMTDIHTSLTELLKEIN